MNATHEPPLIAVNGCLELDPGPRLTLRNRYAEAVLRAGGLPLAIPPVGGPRDVARLVRRVDGLLLSGGDDFCTERLGLGPTHPAAVPTPDEKQDFDVELVRAALEAGTPILGICYGMQLLGIDAGFGLLQHLPEDRPDGQEHRNGVRHPVRVRAGSKLAAALGVEEVEVISRHHQALTGSGAGWSASATDEEGLVEAIEKTTGSWAMGVQWHPELASPGSPDDRLFRALVAAASLHRASRPGAAPLTHPLSV